MFGDEKLNGPDWRSAPMQLAASSRPLAYPQAAIKWQIMSALTLGHSE